MELIIKKKTYMKPIRDFVLVRPFAPEEITEGGLFLPEGFRERNCKAKVISVGNGTAKIKMEAKKDDVIFHIKGAGEPIIVNNELHFLIRHSDILAYLSNN
jgi:co-chaperonin GroES (HSP10)